MKKISYIAWLLLMMPSVKPPTLLFENGTDLTFQAESLILEADELFEGILYHDDVIFATFDEDDFKEGQIVFEINNAGIYTLFNQNDEYLARAIYQDDKVHIAFDTPVKQKKETQYLFRKQPTMWVLSPKEETRMESEKIGESYLYEFKESTVTFEDTTYELFIDETSPMITFDELLEIEENCYLTNQSEITLSYTDTFPEAFPFVENTSEIRIPLNEGINDLSCWLADLAGNKEREKLWIIKDTQQPQVNIDQAIVYINQPQIMEIEEAYLDHVQSYCIWNGNKRVIEGDEITIDESGKLQLYLYDLAGNKKQQEIEIRFDSQPPTITTTILDNQLNLIISEELKIKSLSLIHENAIVDLNEVDVYEFSNEGDYHLSGEIIDLAGNRTWIDEHFLVDLYPPQLELSLENGTVFHEALTFQMNIQDRYLKEWKLHILRNDILLREYEGGESFSQKITLDENLYEDGSAKYDIILWGSDGTYENQLSKSIVLDTKCAPIQIQINGFEASRVNSLLLSNSTLFDLYCEEGVVMWKLYTKDGKVKTGQGASLTLLENQGYTKLELMVEDQYGFTQSKTIYFETAQTNTELLHESNKNEVKQEIVKEVDLGDEVPKRKDVHEVTKTQKEKNNLYVYALGGIALAIIILRQCIFRNLRLRKDESHLSNRDNHSLQDSKDTVLLSSASDQTRIL